MIDSKQLRHVLTVAREGSFSRAAEILALSQPALSSSIARLEDQLKVQVFDRGRHGAELTDAGRVLLLHAEQVERLLVKAENEIKLGRTGIGGPLKVGGTPLALQSIVPAALARLAAEAGRMAVEVEEATDAQLLDSLARCDLDLAVSTIDVGAAVEGIVDLPLFKSGIWVVLRPDHSLAGETRLSLRQIQDHQMALPRPVGTYGVQLTAIYLVAEEPIPSGTIYTSTFATLREIVLQGGAITLVPKQIVQPDIERGLLKAIPLVESVGHRTFGLRRVAGRRLSALGERFCQILLGLAPDYAAE